jgi:hypothetical protein
MKTVFNTLHYPASADWDSESAWSVWLGEDGVLSSHYPVTNETHNYMISFIFRTTQFAKNFSLKASSSFDHTNRGLKPYIVPTEDLG